MLTLYNAKKDIYIRSAILTSGETMAKTATKTKEDIKRVYRSRTNKILGGVAGGIAEYFEIDPVWIRLLFVLMLFAGGFGIIAYIVCWLIIPLEPMKN